MRDATGGYGCEDPARHVSAVARPLRYVAVAFGPRGPEVAVAVSSDGLAWQRLGLLAFRRPGARFADKDAAFFSRAGTIAVQG